MDNLFKKYWEKNRAVLSALGVSEQTASVIFFNGMTAGADLILGNVETGMQNLKTVSNGSKESTGN